MGRGNISRVGEFLTLSKVDGRGGGISGRKHICALSALLICLVRVTQCPVITNKLINNCFKYKIMEFLKNNKRYCLSAVVQLNFPAGSTFPVPVCTVPSSVNRTSRCNKVDAVRLYASYRLNLQRGRFAWKTIIFGVKSLS